MDANTLEALTKVCLRQIRERLEEATSLAKAAEACAETGNLGQGLRIGLDIEQLIYDANTLLNAASLLRRLETT
jgi:hypothetical protein